MRGLGREGPLEHAVLLEVGGHGGPEAPGKRREAPEDGHPAAFREQGLELREGRRLGGRGVEENAADGHPAGASALEVAEDRALGPGAGRGDEEQPRLEPRGKIEPTAVFSDRGEGAARELDEDHVAMTGGDPDRLDQMLDPKVDAGASGGKERIRRRGKPIGRGDERWERTTPGGPERLAVLRHEIVVFPVPAAHLDGLHAHRVAAEVDGASDQANHDGGLAHTRTGSSDTQDGHRRRGHMAVTIAHIPWRRQKPRLARPPRC